MGIREAVPGPRGVEVQIQAQPLGRSALDRSSASTSAARARSASSVPALSTTRSARRRFSAGSIWAAMIRRASSSARPRSSTRRRRRTSSGASTSTTTSKSPSSPTSNRSGISATTSGSPASRRSRIHCARSVLDARVQDRLEAPAGLLVSEHPGAQRGPVQGAVGAEHPVAERGAHLLQAGRAGLHRLACQLVGAHHRHAPSAQAVGHRRLARRHVAGERDAQHPRSSRPSGAGLLRRPAAERMRRRSVHQPAIATAKKATAPPMPSARVAASQLFASQDADPHVQPHAHGQPGELVGEEAGVADPAHARRHGHDRAHERDHAGHAHREGRVAPEPPLEQADPSCGGSAPMRPRAGEDALTRRPPHPEAHGVPQGPPARTAATTGTR